MDGGSCSGEPWADITLLHLESAPHLRPSIVHLQIGISIADIAPPANACAIGGTCWNIFRACNMAESKCIEVQLASLPVQQEQQVKADTSKSGLKVPT